MGKFKDCRQQDWQQSSQIIEPHFSSVSELEDGACYGACVEWLQRQHTHHNENVPDRLLHLTNQAKLIGGRQRMYLSAKAEAETSAGTMLSAERHFEVMSQLQAAGRLKLRYEYLDGGQFSEMAAVANELIGLGGYDYLLINVSLPNGGHAIAMKLGATSRLFDPNFGEFAIPQADLDAFFADYLVATALTGGTYLMVNLAKVHFA